MDNSKTDYKLAIEEHKKLQKQLRDIEGPGEVPPFCSFCGRGKEQYEKSFEGKNNTIICQLCVVDAYIEIMESENYDI